MSEASTLPIYEHFFSWQGEGQHSGRSAYFIRSFGCPVHCPWCDSAGTWHPDYIPKTIEKLSPSTLLDIAVKARPSFIIITGGEPCIHDFSAFCKLASEADIPVHLETSGAFPIKGNFDWITVSPKTWKKPLPETIAQADEIKLIVDSSDCIDRWIEAFPSLAQVGTVWLHPEWSKRKDPQILNAITKWVKAKGDPYRAGYQMHKLFAADEADPQSRAQVPLGGKPELGY